MKDLLKMFFVMLSLLLAACTTPDAPAAALTAPKDVKVSDYGVSSALISWTNTSASADGTVIERSEDAVSYKAVATLGKDDVSFVDKRLTDGTEYHYRLCAYDGSQKSGYVEVSHKFASYLAAPQNFKAELGTEGLVLTWDDEAEGEDGYILSKETASETLENWKVLDANATTYTDTGVKSGKVKYTLQAYSGLKRSEPVSVEFSKMGLPVLSEISTAKSSYMVTVDFLLEDDGGETCTVGVCWSETKTEPTVEDNVYRWSSGLTTGKWGYGNALGLEYGKSYNVRAYATNSTGTVYSSNMILSLDAEPQPITLSWTPVDGYDLPEEVKLYKGSVGLSGGNANLWYAVADLSTGNVELIADKTSSLTTLGRYITDNAATEEFYVMVNGGYFATPAASYSYVAKRGTRLASNIKSLTRVQSYPVTRGAFGVDSEQKPSIKWIYENGAQTWAYDTPLPVVNAEKVLTPSATYPEKAEIWNNYSGMGGGPVLLRNGRICFDHLLTKEVRYKTNYELLQDDIFGPRVRPPRTVVGYTADGKVVLMVCDGRNSGGSQGATLTEMAMLMKGVGCTDVLNLDGGGSTVICAGEDGKELNVPSDGTQRKLISYIGFVKKK